MVTTIQIDGKFCTQIDMPENANHKEIADMIQTSYDVQDQLAGRKIRSIAIIPDKLINVLTP